MALTNWAGNVSFRAAAVHRPTSIGELRLLVSRCPRLRALGTGHSFSRIADTEGDLVSVATLPPLVEIDSAAGTALVGAGLRYGEIAPRLHAAGWALPNLASLPHISVAGACATATHGSGDGNAALSSSVREIELVRADGELIRLRRGEPDFSGAVVSLGLLGIATQLVLDLVPAFDVSQRVYDNLPLDVLLADLEAVFGSAYSVSAFTDWRGPVINQVWRKQLDGESPWDLARPADGPRHPVAGMPAKNCTMQLGVAGPWSERLPHFRLDFTPSSGDELQSEFLVDRADAAAAIESVAAIRDRIAPVLQVCEIRTVAGDDAWLSPAYGRDSVAIHFTWIADTAAVLPVVTAVEGALAAYQPRPHWGKIFTADPAPLYPRLDDALDLRARLDPTRKFG